MKANEPQQQQPVPGTSGGATKDKKHVAPLRPKKRLRPNPSSLSVNSPGLLPSTTGSVQDSKSSGDEGASVDISITSSFTSGMHPDQQPIPSPSESSSITIRMDGNSTISPGPVTIIPRNLSVELRAQAVAFADQLVVPSIISVKQEEEVGQPELIGSPEGELRIGQRNQVQVISPAERNTGDQNVRQNVNHQNPDNANPDQAHNLIPYESLGFRTQQEVQANRNRGPDAVPEDTEMSVEEEARATTQVLTSLHNAIHAVRVEFINLTNLNFHRRAPVAMSVLGFVVDSLINFVANYLNPEKPVEH